MNTIFTYIDFLFTTIYFFTPIKVFGYLEVGIDNELVLNDVSFYKLAFPSREFRANRVRGLGLQHSKI